MSLRLLVLLGLTACTDVYLPEDLDVYYEFPGEDYTDACTWRSGEPFYYCSQTEDGDTGYEVEFGYNGDDFTSGQIFANYPVDFPQDSSARPSLPSTLTFPAYLTTEGTCATEHAFVITDAADALLMAGGSVLSWEGLGWRVEGVPEDSTCEPKACAWDWEQVGRVEPGDQCAVFPVRFTHLETGSSLRLQGAGVGLMDGYQLVVFDAVAVEGAGRYVFDWYIQAL